MYLWHSHDDWDEVKTRELIRVKTMQSQGNSEVSGVKGVNECILHRFYSDLPSHYARSATI